MDETAGARAKRLPAASGSKRRQPANGSSARQACEWRSPSRLLLPPAAESRQCRVGSELAKRRKARRELPAGAGRRESAETPSPRSPTQARCPPAPAKELCQQGMGPAEVKLSASQPAPGYRANNNPQFSEIPSSDPQFRRSLVQTGWDIVRRPGRVHARGQHDVGRAAPCRERRSGGPDLTCGPLATDCCTPALAWDRDRDKVCATAGAARARADQRLQASSFETSRRTVEQPLEKCTCSTSPIGRAAARGAPSLRARQLPASS